MPTQALTDLGTLHELAKTLAALQWQQLWPYYAIILVLAFITSGAGAWVGAYLKIRGENFARQTDFDNVLVQLAHQTRLTEGIGAKIASAHWIGQERNRTLRQKLEEYGVEIAELDGRLDKQKEANIFGPTQIPLFSDPMARADMLQVMFFPEIVEVHTQLRRAVSDYKIWYLKIRAARLRRYVHGINKDLEEIPPKDEERAPFEALYPPILAGVHAVEQAYRTRMAELLHETIEHERQGR